MITFKLLFNLDIEFLTKKSDLCNYSLGGCCSMHNAYCLMR